MGSTTLAGEYHHPHVSNSQQMHMYQTSDQHQRGSPATQSCEGKGHVTWNRIKVTCVRIKQPCEYLSELKCTVVLAATCVRDPDVHYSWESLGSPSGTHEHGEPELPVLELELKKRLH